MKILNRKTLELINEEMIKRGDYNDTGEGYTPTDWLFFRGRFLKGLNNTQLSLLAERLVFYCEDRLNVSKNVMKATAAHYKALAAPYESVNGVTVEVVEGIVRLGFDYNQNIIKVCKSYDADFNRDSVCWECDKKNILNILSELKLNGLYVDTAIDYIEQNLKVDVRPKEILEKINKEESKIKVVKTNKITIEIKFEYNSEIVNAIKKLWSYKYNLNRKSWTILKKEVNYLVKYLKKIKNINYDGLKPFILEDISRYKLIDINTLPLKPYNYQIEAGDFLLQKQKAILADEMGVGKTFSSIIAGLSIAGKKLVVCPASLKLNWRKEIGNLCSDEVEIIDGGRWRYNKNKSTKWYIINYDILDKYIDILSKIDIECMIVDEAHYIKGVKNGGKPSSIRAKEVLKMSKITSYVFLLTGTPIPNQTKDIFNLLKAIDHPLGSNFWRFAKRYCGARRSDWGWDMKGSSNMEELNMRLKECMLRRMKDDVLELPDKIRTFIPQEINIKNYLSQIDSYMKNRKGLTDGEKLVRINALRMELANQKTDKTISFTKDILEQGESVVIFTNYTKVLNKIYDTFKDVAVKIDGSCSSKARQNAVDLFQSGKKKIFVGNLEAAGEGLTLTKSHTIIFNDYSWLPSLHQQGEDRCHRVGTKNNVNVYYMYAENASIDKCMTKMLDDKIKNSSKIIDGKEADFIKTIDENILFA